MKDMSNPFELDQKHLDYFNSVIEELVKAEKTVERIKKDLRWKRAYDYFSLCKHRGWLKVRPTKENGYKIELSEKALNRTYKSQSEKRKESLKKYQHKYYEEVTKKKRAEKK